MTTTDHHRQGLALFRRLHESKCDDYEQLRQLSTMVLGASFMLDAASPEAHDLDTFSQKVEARISVLLGVDKWMQSA